MSRRAPRRAAPNPPRPRAPRRLPWVGLGGGAGVLLILALAAAWWWQRGPAFAVQPDADRNVLLVTIDTLRADALSSYGGPADTPNLDRLAAHGARFTFAHSHAVVTLVSHTTILTGQYPYEHGVRDNSGYRVPPGTVTVATRLKPLGFATGAFVGGFPLVKRFGLSPGFDVYDDKIGEMQGAIDFSLPERRADVVVSRALDWINRQHGRFFAWVHVFDPHAPYRPPDEWLARYPTQPYYGEVAWTDHALGPLFDRLATLPRRTLVIVTGDHGEGLGDHGETTHGMFAYESTLHIPLIVADIDPKAARVPRGVVVTTPVRHIDILPTILDAVNAAADRALPGASLLDVIRRGSGGDRPEYFEAMTGTVARDWAPLRGVLVGRDKYIDLPIPERYDLAGDPREQQNLVAADTGRTQVLLNTLRTYNVAPPGRPTREIEAVAEQLRALGYVSSGPQPDKQTFTEDDDPKHLIKIDQELHNATDAYQHGRYQESIALFQKVLNERPGTADTYKYLAFVYWQIGQPNAAIATLENALQRGLRDREVPVRLGNYLSEIGHAARAVALLEHMPPDDVDALNALGMAYSQTGRTADALQTFKKVLAIDPSNGFAYQNIGVVQLRAGQLQDAERSLKQALDADPALASAYTTLGVVLASTARKNEAIDCWKRAVELDGTEYRALYNVTVELAAAGRIEEARAYGQRFINTAPPAFYKDDIAKIRGLIAR
jgi:tetratricopeptide (TPR) repeat protein